MFKPLLLLALCAPLITQAQNVAENVAGKPAEKPAEKSAEPPATHVAPIPRVEIIAARDAEWASYRRAYQAAALSATYTRSRPLIQAHMQIRPLKPDASLAGLKLQLAGDTTQADIDVDGIGRATIPMSKQAYDEDAVLRLNRGKGLYYFSGRFSIREHADGVYPVAQLRAACEQLIGAQRASGYRLRLLGKNCSGVKFSYPASDAAMTVEVRGADGAPRPVGVIDGHPFEDNSMGVYKVALLRFADLPADGSVVTRAAPLAIGTVYE